MPECWPQVCRVKITFTELPTNHFVFTQKNWWNALLTGFHWESTFVWEIPNPTLMAKKSNFMFKFKSPAHIWMSGIRMGVFPTIWIFKHLAKFKSRAAIVIFAGVLAHLHIPWAHSWICKANLLVTHYLKICSSKICFIHGENVETWFFAVVGSRAYWRISTHVSLFAHVNVC